MDFLPQVVRAEYLGGHGVHLVFNDGLEGGGTVAWPNVADIAPETLYERAKASAAA